MAVEPFQHQLSNGLSVVAEINPDAHTSAVGFFVKTGARDEAAEVMGVSHFLEHMMFKGTERRSADDINREFDQLGANYNAFTSHETTVYWAQVLPEFFAQAFDLLGDMLRPSLREDDFNIEKNVILEEIGMYDDRPQWRLSDALLEHHFSGLPLGYRVLGTVDTIKALGVDQMRGYFEQRYSADNITVAAAGRIDRQQLIDELERIAGDWKPSGATRDYPQPTIAGERLNLPDPKVNRQYIAAMCAGPSTQDDRRYTAKVLSDVLGDTEGSRLYWALVDPGLADEADFSYMPQDQIGSYFAYASCAPNRTDQVEKILLDTLDSYADSVDADEIERAKNKLATQATVHEESPAGRMRGLGVQWLYLGRYVSLKEELERIMSVTADDVRALIGESGFQPRTVVRLGPGG